MNWENAGVCRGNLLTEKEYNKLSDSEKAKIHVFDFNGETMYAEERSTARGIIVKRLGKQVSFVDFWSDKVFTQEYLEELNEKVIHPLFPELKKEGEAISYIASNMVMNMLGLGNAATPFGLKAFECMQKENPKQDTATRSMITFLVINTASVTLIPTTVISFRVLNHSKNPTEIVGACLIATVLSCVCGIILDRIFYHIWRAKHD